VTWSTKGLYNFSQIRASNPIRPQKTPKAYKSILFIKVIWVELAKAWVFGFVMHMVAKKNKIKSIQCPTAHFTHICVLGIIISWSDLSIWNDWCSLFDAFNFYMILLHKFHEVMPYCKSHQHEPWYILRYLANSWYAIIL